MGVNRFATAALFLATLGTLAGVAWWQVRAARYDDVCHTLPLPLPVPSTAVEGCAAWRIAIHVHLWDDSATATTTRDQRMQVGRVVRDGVVGRYPFATVSVGVGVHHAAEGFMDAAALRVVMAPPTAVSEGNVTFVLPHSAINVGVRSMPHVLPSPTHGNAVWLRRWQQAAGTHSPSHRPTCINLARPPSTPSPHSDNDCVDDGDGDGGWDVHWHVVMYAPPAHLHPMYHAPDGGEGGEGSGSDAPSWRRPGLLMDRRVAIVTVEGGDWMAAAHQAGAMFAQAAPPQCQASEVVVASRAALVMATVASVCTEVSVHTSRVLPQPVAAMMLALTHSVMQVVGDPPHVHTRDHEAAYHAGLGISHAWVAGAHYLRHTPTIAIDPHLSLHHRLAIYLPSWAPIILPLLLALITSVKSVCRKRATARGGAPTPPATQAATHAHTLEAKVDTPVAPLPITCTLTGRAQSICHGAPADMVIRSIRPCDDAAIRQLYRYGQWVHIVDAATRFVHSHWCRHVLSTDLARPFDRYGHLDGSKAAFFVATMPMEAFTLLASSTPPMRLGYSPTTTTADEGADAHDGEEEVPGDGGWKAMLDDDGRAIVGTVGIVPWQPGSDLYITPAAAARGEGPESGKMPWPEAGVIDSTAELIRMCVHPALHRCGVASHLVARVCQWCTTPPRTYTRVYLSTLNSMSGAVPLYQASGFAYVPGSGDGKGILFDYHGHPVHIVQLERHVALPPRAAAAPRRQGECQGSLIAGDTDA